MDESRALQRAGWAGAASIVLLVVGVALGYLVGVDNPSMSDAAILERLNDDARQAAAGSRRPCSLRGSRCCSGSPPVCGEVLDRLSGGDPLAHATVPAAALFGGLTITGVSLDVSSAFAAWSDEFTADPDTVRALGMAGQVLGLTGLIGCGVLVAVTTRIARAGARPADVGGLGVVRRRRTVPVRLLERRHGVRGLRTVAHRCRHRGAARSAADTAAAVRPAAERTGSEAARSPRRHQRLTPQPTVAGGLMVRLAGRRG